MLLQPNKIQSLKVGTLEVNKVFLGNTLVYYRTIVPYNIIYLDPLNGNDGNSGLTPLLPKLTNEGIIPIFIDNIELKIKGDTNIKAVINAPYNSKVSSYDLNDYYPVITNATKIVDVNITKTSGRTNIYQFNYTSQEVSQTGYDYPFPIVINKLNETLLPFSSRNYPKYVASLDLVDSTENSFTFIQDSDNITMYIHPIGSVLDLDTYRYEASQLSNAINTRLNNCSISELILRDSVDGYGPLNAGINFNGSKLIIQGGGTHLGVINQGILNWCLLLPGMKGGDPGDIGVVFYSDSGAGLNAKYKNIIVFDMTSAFYVHTNTDHSPTTDYETLTYDNCYAFNVNTPYGGSNCKSIIITKCYCEDSNYFFMTTVDSSLIDKCIANNTYSGFALVSNFDFSETKLMTIQNSFVKKLGRKSVESNPAQNIFTNNQPGFKTVAKYNLLYFYNRIPYSAQYIELDAFGGGCKELETKYNVIIVDCDNLEGDSFPNYYQMVLGNDLNTITYQDYNVYIVLKGNPIWLSRNSSQGSGDPGIYSYAVWLTTGHDTNSLFLDLRNTPERINEIFADYSNGDWTMLNGDLSDSIRAIVGTDMENYFPNHYPTKPTYEEAYNIIKNGNIAEDLIL